MPYKSGDIIKLTHDGQALEVIVRAVLQPAEVPSSQAATPAGAADPGADQPPPAPEPAQPTPSEDAPPVAPDAAPRPETAQTQAPNAPAPFVVLVPPGIAAYIGGRLGRPAAAELTSAGLPLTQAFFEPSTASELPLGPEAEPSTGGLALVRSAVPQPGDERKLVVYMPTAFQYYTDLRNAGLFSQSQVLPASIALKYNAWARAVRSAPGFSAAQTMASQAKVRKRVLEIEAAFGVADASGASEVEAADADDINSEQQA